MEEVDTPLREASNRNSDEMMEQLMNRLERLQAPRKEFKPPTYNGETDVELFLTQFKDVAIMNRWEPLETLLHLRGCLQGKATECGREATLEETFDSLRGRFGISPKQAKDILKTIRKKPQQSFHEISSEISRLVQIAHPRESAEFKRDTMLDTFSTAVVHTPLRHHLLAKPHNTLAEAVAICEDYVRVNDTKARLAAATSETEPTTSKEISVLQGQMEAMKRMIVELTQARQPPPPLPTQSYAYQEKTRQAKPGPCFHCRGEHLKRNCPYLPPRTAPPNRPPVHQTQQVACNYEQSEQRVQPEPAWQGADNSHNQQRVQPEPAWQGAENSQAQLSENFQGLAQ